MRDIYGATPLYRAAASDRIEIAKILLQNKAELNFVAELQRESALHVAVFNGSKEMVRILIENGADLKIKDAYGKTPSDVAMVKSNKEVFDLLENTILSPGCTMERRLR